MSLDDFKNWALSQGSVAKTDGGYLGECVSLINQYLSKVYGIQAGAWGHAKDWATNSNVLQHFDRVGDLQRGDIVVWGPNFGGGYGHIGIYLGNGQLLDQNGRIARRVSVGANYPGYIAILRRKGQTNQGGSDVITNQDRDNLRIINSEVKGWDFNATHTGQYDQRELQAWVGLPFSRFIQEAWNEGGAWRDMRNQKLANYDNLVKQVDVLKANPTKAELQAVIDQLKASQAKVAELEAKVPDGTNPDDIVVSRGFWNGLFDKIKNLISRG